jgi:hypothetical protein
MAWRVTTDDGPSGKTDPRDMPLARALFLPAMLMAIFAATLAATRRRTVIAVAEPAPQLPAPLPTVDRFEIIEAGSSALLRVHAEPPADPRSAVLVLDRGDAMDLVSALPSKLVGGALGFACDLALLDGAPDFWLQVGSGTVALGTPVAR